MPNSEWSPKRMLTRYAAIAVVPLALWTLLWIAISFQDHFVVDGGIGTRLQVAALPIIGPVLMLGLHGTDLEAAAIGASALLLTAAGVMFCRHAIARVAGYCGVGLWLATGFLMAGVSVT